MPTQLMTYDDLAAAWGVSRDAARKKVEGLRIPRQTGNDGKARIMIDLAEVQHQPLTVKRDRRPGGDRAETEALREHVKTLRAEVDRVAALAEAHRADFERERDRAEKAVTELVDLATRLIEAEKGRAEKVADFEKACAETDEVRAEASRLRAELAGWR